VHRGLAIFRVLVSVSILAVLFAGIPFTEVIARARTAHVAALAAALVLVVLMYVLLSMRWRTLARPLGVELPLRSALRAVFLGLFGGQLLPASLGSDLVRGWAVLRHANSVPRAAASVIADRLVGLLGACLLLALVNAALGSTPLPFAPVLVPAAVLASGALLLGFLLACRSALHLLPISAAALIALLIHTLHVFAASLSAAAYSVEASLAVWFCLPAATASPPRTRYSCR
jgi:uncharacterized protein (TIRG00374 family)